VEARSDLFEGGDVGNGKLMGQKVRNLVLIEGLEMEMSNMVDKSRMSMNWEVRREVRRSSRLYGGLYGSSRPCRSQIQNPTCNQYIIYIYCKL